MRESRGRELPGAYNPLIVAELFSKQCKPWQSLVCSPCERVLSSAYAAVNDILRHSTDEGTAVSLLREIIGPSMENLKQNLAIKAEEIMKPHLSGHLIAYNHYLTENVQKAQASRHRLHLEKRLKTFFKKDELPHGTAKYLFDMGSLVDTVVSHTEPDMDSFSYAMATDTMEAHYKVSAFFIFSITGLTSVRSL